MVPNVTEWFPPSAAAAYIDVKVQTLAVWRTKDRYGLPYVKIGRLVKYRKSDLDAWLASRRVTCTAECK